MVHLLENNLDISYKTKHILTMRSSYYTSWYLHKGAENLCPHTNLITDVYSSIINHCQNLEVTKISSSRQMDG